jgi:bifunctional ADP-heptose synthase (sugar kinase/adenylyltransferase)
MTQVEPKISQPTECELMVYSHKTVHYEDLLDEQFRKSLLGDRFTIVTGGFDLTHFNHLVYLKEIYRLTGKPLLVLPDTDDMLDFRKSKLGDTRPVLPFEIRSATLGLMDEVSATAPHPGDDVDIVDDLVREGVTLVRSTHTHSGLTEHDENLFDRVYNLGGEGLVMPPSGFFEMAGGVELSTSNIIKKIKRQ